MYARSLERNFPSAGDAPVVEAHDVSPQTFAALATRRARQTRQRGSGAIVTGSRYAFRIVNVFAEERLAGNPLAVFDDARGLDAATMQALALQFNLSETTFILPSTKASARVRIFTPTFEMPFAGHPTLGTAHVVRALRGRRHPDAGDARRHHSGACPGR